jgi:tight adherence protein C
VIVALFLGTMAGFGCLGVHWAFRAPPASLEAVATAVSRPYDGVPGPDPVSGLSDRVGSWVTSRFGDGPLAQYGRWTSLRPCWAITGDSAERMVSRSLLLGGIGLLAPPLLWMAGAVAGVSFPVDAAIVMSLVAMPLGLAWPVISVLSRARERRHHCRVVLGSFVDLVVLGLAGGVGVEGALFAASQVSSDWAAKRIARTLVMARDRGVSPWFALGQLGEEIGVAELVELSATLQLAGTEGARILQSLTARSLSLRRHEQADAESEANSTTERLFIPGSLLLLGFLLFVGYPAFARILGGF